MKKIISTATALVFTLGLAAAASAEATGSKTPPAKPVAQAAKAGDIKDKQVDTKDIKKQNPGQLAKSHEGEKDPAKVKEGVKTEMSKPEGAKPATPDKPAGEKGKPEPPKDVKEQGKEGTK